MKKRKNAEQLEKDYKSMKSLIKPKLFKKAFGHLPLRDSGSIKQLYKHNLQIVAVHPFKKIFLMFTTTGIYAYGDPKEIAKCKIGQ